ncbi:MAG: ribonuclease T, partial [Methylobacterium sp.]|nr:ribonuclease T [Methylobacterium sp.]
PSEGLARHQWRKHGTCSGSSPSDYFADTRRAREKVAIPPALAKAGREQNWTAIDIERAFVDANPGLRTDMMSVACRRGVLQEVRICLSKDLRNFRMCEEVDRSGCRTRDITVPAPR